MGDQSSEERVSGISPFWENEVCEDPFPPGRSSPGVTSDVWENIVSHQCA